MQINSFVLEDFKRILMQLSRIQPRSHAEQPSAEYLNILGYFMAMDTMLRSKEVYAMRFSFLCFLTYLYMHYNDMEHLWLDDNYKANNSNNN